MPFSIVDVFASRSLARQYCEVDGLNAVVGKLAIGFVASGEIGVDDDLISDNCMGVLPEIRSV